MSDSPGNDVLQTRSPEAPGAAQDFEPHLAQVAFSVIDLAVTARWFREGLGFQAAGGSRWRMRGPLAASIQGLPKVASTCSWLVGGNDFFQLELFEFQRPLTKLTAHDVQRSDIGYRGIGVWVADFDKVLADLASLGTTPLDHPTGGNGGRRACVQNPDGVYVEIMEADPLAGGGLVPDRTARPVVLRSVTLSVPDLSRSSAFFRSLGLPEVPTTSGEAEHRSPCGAGGIDPRRAVLRAGGVHLEIVEHLDPLGRPRPVDHRICDQGILNIAFGARNSRDHLTLYHRALDAGARSNRSPVRLPGGGVVYVTDPDDFSVELLWMSPKQDRFWGFVPRLTGRRTEAAPYTVEHTAHIAASREATWDALTNHDTMSDWLPLASVERVADGTPNPDGRGSTRRLRVPGWSIVEQVVESRPPLVYRYRAMSGTPFACHHGEVFLRAIGEETALTWQIRFRPKVPGTGRPLALVLSRLLGRAVRSGLRTHVEQLDHQPNHPQHPRQQGTSF